QSQLVTTASSTDANGNVLALVSRSNDPTYHPSRVLVRFRGAPAFLAGSGAARGFAGDQNLFLVANPPGLSVAEAVSRYRAHPAVLYAEPDYVRRVINTPTDPL